MDPTWDNPAHFVLWMLIYGWTLAAVVYFSAFYVGQHLRYFWDFVK